MVGFSSFHPQIIGAVSFFFFCIKNLLNLWCFLKVTIFVRADVLRENAEAVFAACDAAHGRWAKLLGVRALLHPKLRLVEFLSIYNITQEFITATEKVFIYLVFYMMNFFSCLCLWCYLYANINRLVEGWVIVFVEQCNHRLKLLLISSMKCELVSFFSFPFFRSLFLWDLCNLSSG